ncbi:hypothetical protein BIT28_03425 [Photobacterium proteolyticum]|uniref:Uncharacterized protein n=1 Tax=Photobacterium proteolyticum TaxID=1903952 RepID=A0A1Q9GA59_9GAMM|nr:hypothetical protein BIT28_03425 [Photobacterium proteolyticum]
MTQVPAVISHFTRTVMINLEESSTKTGVMLFGSAAMDLRFRNTYAEKWQKFMMAQATELSEYDVIDIKSCMVKLGLSERVVQR